MKRYLTIKTPHSSLETKLFIEEKFPEEDVKKICSSLPSSYAVISDDHVAKLYGKQLLNFFKKQGFRAELFTFPQGEKNKTRETKEKLEDALFQGGFKRDSCLVALGGGVSLDLVGFIASTFCRGVPYLSFPTSLLAMADACIGGKTGVNLPYGKNLIGTFYPPRAIFTDLSALKTLSDKDMMEGIAEIIKHALIGFEYLIEMLEENEEKWKKRDLAFFKDLLIANARAKVEIVERDWKDEHKRAVLNFGHTIGHAIERLENYQISHGQATAMGMVAESLLALRMQRIDQETFDYIHQMIQKMGFTFTLSSHVTSTKLLQAIAFDKKTKNQVPHFVILDGIGSVAPFGGNYCSPVEEDHLQETLSWMLTAFSDSSQERA